MPSNCAAYSTRARGTARSADDGTSLLVALTSIHWREAWKYGERAFRYCQHDLGHAIAAVSVAAGLVGWRAALLPAWSHRAIAAVTGIDREEDFTEAEREEPGCIMALTAAATVRLLPGRPWDSSSTPSRAANGRATRVS